MGEGVAGGGDRAHAHPVPDLDDLAVAHRGAVEGHLVLAVDEVRGAGALRERQTAGDVVVVDVGLEDVGEAHAVLVEQVEDAVDVALRVDHEGDLAVVDEVAAVAERRASRSVRTVRAVMDECPFRRTGGHASLEPPRGITTTVTEPPGGLYSWGHDRLHAVNHHRAPLRRDGGCGARAARGGGLRRAHRDRPQGDAEDEARRRRRSADHPGRLPTRARPPGAPGGAVDRGAPALQRRGPLGRRDDDRGRGLRPGHHDDVRRRAERDAARRLRGRPGRLTSALEALSAPDTAEGSK